MEASKPTNTSEVAFAFCDDIEEITITLPQCQPKKRITVKDGDGHIVCVIQPYPTTILDACGETQ